MIRNFEKHAENGLKLSKKHSHNYDLSSEAMLALIETCKGAEWKLAIEAVNIGIDIGYRMAKHDYGQNHDTQVIHR